MLNLLKKLFSPRPKLVLKSTYSVVLQINQLLQKRAFAPITLQQIEDVVHSIEDDMPGIKKAFWRHWNAQESPSSFWFFLNENMVIEDENPTFTKTAVLDKFYYLMSYSKYFNHTY